MLLLLLQRHGLERITIDLSDMYVVIRGVALNHQHCRGRPRCRNGISGRSKTLLQTAAGFGNMEMLCRHLEYSAVLFPNLLPYSLSSVRCVGLFYDAIPPSALSAHRSQAS